MNEKKAYHFNWVDALVCLVLVLLTLGAVFKFVLSDKTSTAAAVDTITYVVHVTGLKDETVDAFQVGDELFDSDTGASVGVIQAVESIPAETVITYPDGTAQWGTVDGRSDVFLTVEAQGTVTADRQHMVNGTYRVSVGSQRNLNTLYRSFAGRIWSVS